MGNLKKLTIKNQKGFTLIEVVLTLIIFAVIILIYTSLTSTSFASRVGRYTAIAVKIATKKIEQVRNSQWDSLPASGSFSDTDLSKLPNGQTNISVSDTATSNLKQVTVTVSWQEGQAAKDIKLETLITEGGIGKL